MASAKQIKARKAFAKKFAKKGKKKTLKKTPQQIKDQNFGYKNRKQRGRSLEQVQGEVEGMERQLQHTKVSYTKKRPLMVPRGLGGFSKVAAGYGMQSGGILEEDNSWHVLIPDDKTKSVREYVVHLDPAYFRKYNYRVGDEISIDAELEFFFEAMRNAKLDADDIQDMSKMNKGLNLSLHQRLVLFDKSFTEYKSRA